MFRLYLSPVWLTASHGTGLISSQSYADKHIMQACLFFLFSALPLPVATFPFLFPTNRYSHYGLHGAAAHHKIDM